MWVLQIGLIGKANVGKSTFFSAATETTVASGNFPFTTIEPNVGVFPNQFKLYPAYPNPFNPLTTIQFDVETVLSKSVLNIYNISGKNVATLINERLKSGSYEVQWDASSFSSGVYFSELISGGKRVSQKMILLK